MPSKSKAQHNLMAMVAHDPKAAKRVGIPQSVGRDYVEADKGRKFGDSKMKTKKYAAGGLSEFGKAFKAARDAGDKTFEFKGKKYSTARADDKESSGGKKATSDMMADVRSGTTKFRGELAKGQAEAAANAPRADAAGFRTAMGRAQSDAASSRTPRSDVKGFGAAMRRAQESARERPFGMKKGGSVYRRAADGITQRGKTKGTEVRMARGGSVGSASKRADGCAMKGKTKGRFV